MREILFRGKDGLGQWLYGGFVRGEYPYVKSFENSTTSYIVYTDDFCRYTPVVAETVGQFTGLTDKNGTKIFEGDIVRYNTYDDFDCHSIVKFGEYKQDGSSGEYNGRKCIGFYVDVDNFTCPDWCDNEPEYFSDYMWQQNILEVASECEIIGNIHDNPELLEME